MIGQDAVGTAKAFNERLNLDGVILTKLDGDARGGAALSVKEVTGRPILFVGVGEKLEDFEPFYPDRMYRPARFVTCVKVLTFRDVNVEELATKDL